MKSLRLGITMGCPVGIGPEIILKALNQKKDLIERCLIIGDINILNYTKKLLNLDLKIVEVDSPEHIITNKVNVISVTRLDINQLKLGKPDKITGKASYTYIKKAIEFALSKKICAIVTAPISKIGLKYASINFPGHTEILAHFSNTKKYAMMLAGKKLKVVLVTIHAPLKEVPKLISKEKIIDLLSLINLSFKIDMGIKEPKIAVCGLNPHAGENGMFGQEEIEIIEPAIKNAQKMGINAKGPFPPDTIFYRAVNGEFDVVLCQYHDQGLIPLKLLHFKDGVNVTLGLPFIRTSVDHGTAYDISGKNLADPTSLIEASYMAWNMAKNRKII